MTSLERAILSTLCYADVFDYPLMEAEMWKYLIGQKTRLSKFRVALTALQKSKKIIQKNEYYFLAKRNGVVKHRLMRSKVANKKLQIARSAARLLAYIPTVRLIGVSGALAMNNAPLEDDIDFFIITSKNYLWTTRLLCALVLDILKIRRKPGVTRFKDRICINMFLDEQELSLPKKERDLYSAHEIAQMKPLVNKKNTYEIFLHKNIWVKKLLPHSLPFLGPRPKSQIKQKNRGKSLVELVCKNLQLRYMQKRRTQEITSAHMLRFHPVDARDRVIKGFEIRMKTLFT